MYSRKLTTFISVAEQGSFLKASKELYITAAAVMHQIDKLEATVGVKLIERTSQGTQLTAPDISYFGLQITLNQTEYLLYGCSHIFSCIFRITCLTKRYHFTQDWEKCINTMFIAYNCILCYTS